MTTSERSDSYSEIISSIPIVQMIGEKRIQSSPELNATTLCDELIQSQVQLWTENSNIVGM